MTTGAGLSPANQAQTESQQVEPRWFVCLRFDEGPVCVHSGLGDIFTLGELYLGLGSLGSISGSSSSTELSAKPVTLNLSGIPAEYMALALGSHYQGRRAEIYLGFMQAGALVDDPHMVGRYRMDTCDIQVGEETLIAITLQDPMASWARPRIRRYTHEDQQLAFPGDRGFEHVPQMVDREIIWGTV